MQIFFMNLREAMIFRQPFFLASIVLGATLASLLSGSVFAQSPGLSPAEQIYAQLAKLPPAERTAQIEAGARKEGNISIIQTVRNNIGIGQIDMFQKRYPFLKLDVTNSLGSPEGAERLYTEESAGRHLTDTINVTIFDMSELLKDNMLARFPTPETARILPKYRDTIDNQNRYAPANWSERGMVYNTNLVLPDKAPKKWMDLCDPFFKGNFSFDPVQERLVAGFYALFGAQTADFIRCLGANKPIVQRGIQERFTLMMAGDIWSMPTLTPIRRSPRSEKIPTFRCRSHRHPCSPVSARSASIETPRTPMHRLCSRILCCRMQSRTSCSSIFAVRSL